MSATSHQVNLRKTEIHVLTWLKDHPGWYKSSWGPVQRLLRRGFLERYIEGNAHGLLRVTAAGRSALSKYAQPHGGAAL